MLAVKETEIAYAKLCEKIFLNKRINKQLPRGDEHKPSGNIVQAYTVSKEKLF